MNINRQIVNRAMDKAGEEPILEEEWNNNTSVRVRLVKDYYLATILETLANTEWTSRKKREPLVEDTAGLNWSENAYKYFLPIDCAKPISLQNNADYIVEGNYLLTDKENAILTYVSNAYTGERKWAVAEVQPTQETWESMKYAYYDEETEKYVDAENYVEGKTYYLPVDEDYPLYDDIDFDPLLSEYIETRLASKMVLKLTGNKELYQLLYNEAILMEKRAVNVSQAHGYNKAKGSEYWGKTLGLPDYEEI